MKMLTRDSIMLLFILAFSIHCFPQKFTTFQTWDADSLQAVLPAQQSEVRVNTLNRLAVSLYFIDTALSRDYAYEAMELSRKISYEEGIAGAFRNYGYIEQYKGNYSVALGNYLEALALFEKLGRKHTAAWVCYDISKTHFFASNYAKTIEYGNLAMAKFREKDADGITMGNVQDTIMVRAGIARTLSAQGLPGGALDIYRHNLRIMKQNSFSTMEVILITWVMGVEFYALGITDSAIAHFQEAISFPDDDFNIMAQKYRAMIWLGVLYYSLGKTDSAIFYQQQAVKWYEEKGFLIWALWPSNLLGYYYYKEEDLINGKKNFIKSERIFNEMLALNSWLRHDSLKNKVAYGYELYFPVPELEMKSLAWDWGEWMYHGLFRIYEKTGNTKEALKYHILYANAGDSLNKIMRERETVEIQTRYESERNEKQIEFLSAENDFKSFKLRQSRIILFGLAGLVTLVILLALALIRQGRLREKQNSLILQQKLFRSQMNPHFIFNSLSSIHHFMINEKPAKAATYLSKFSKLIRNILQGSMDEYTSLANEIGIIENYLELQKLRFPGKFEFDIEVDKQLDPEHISIPSMITQPFVENAIEHGLRYKEGKGRISIRVRRKDDQTIFEVEDDGIGREKARQLQSERDKDHHSLATSLIMDRIRALNRTNKKKITLNITDLENDQGEPSGTRVVLELPLM